jgi:hypothetical protein
MGVSNVLQMALVLVAIVISFYVALKMIGSVNEAPIPDESIDFLNITTTHDAYMNWKISVYMINTGNSSVTLEKALVNSMEVSEYSSESPSEIVSTLTTSIEEGTDLKSGEVKRATIWIGGRFGFFNSGSVLDIKFKSSLGNKFVKTTILP